MQYVLSKQKWPSMWSEMSAYLFLLLAAAWVYSATLLLIAGDMNGSILATCCARRRMSTFSKLGVTASGLPSDCPVRIRGVDPGGGGGGQDMRTARRQHPALRRGPLLSVQDSLPIRVLGNLELMGSAVVGHGFHERLQPILDVKNGLDPVGCGCLTMRLWDDTAEVRECCDVGFLDFCRNPGEELVHIFMCMAGHQEANLHLVPMEYNSNKIKWWIRNMWLTTFASGCQISESYNTHLITLFNPNCNGGGGGEGAQRSPPQMFLSTLNHHLLYDLFSLKSYGYFCTKFAKIWLRVT